MNYEQISDLIKRNGGSFKPSAKKDIAEAEKKLGIRFDKNLTEYLTKMGSISIDYFETYGAVSGKEYSIVDATRDLSDDHDDMPKNLVVISEDGFGNQYAYVNDKGYIVFIDHESDEGLSNLEKDYDSIEDFLEKEINIAIKN